MTSRVLNSLSYNLAQSYFSGWNYYQKGYMADWLVNSARDLGIDTVTIDILNKTIEPIILLNTPLIAFFNHTKSIIFKTLKSNNFPDDYIIEAKFIIKIVDDRWIRCSSYVRASNDKVYKSKDYIEKSYEVFRVFDPFSKQLLTDDKPPKKKELKQILFKLFKQKFRL